MSEQILTEDELEALPKYSVVIDDDQDVWQKRGGSWASYETSLHTSKKLLRFGPLTLVYKGEKR